MKPFTSYIKTQLNVNYGISALKYRFTREKRKLWEPILIAVAIFVGLVPLLFLYTIMMSGVFAAGAVMGQPEIVLVTAFLFAQLVIFFFGIPYIMGTFYFSQDMESLVPLPLKPYEVIGGKFAVIMINEYLTALPVLLPPVIIYGAGTGQNLLYWLKALLLMLLAPVIPIAAASVIIVALMRFINFRRYKDLLAVIGGLLVIALSIGLNFFIQNLSRSGDPEFIKRFLAERPDLVELIGDKFPPSVWAAKGLSAAGIEGFGYFLLFLAVSAAFLLFLLWLSNKFFYKSLLAGQEVTRKRRRLTGAELDRQYEHKESAVSALMQKEWKLLFRTPVYALNGLTGFIIGPLIILIMLFTQKGNEDSMQLFELIKSPGTAPYVLLGGLGLMLFTAGMNPAASTSMSREGNNFWISKLIPVTARQQVTAKFLVSYLISAAGVIVTGLILWIFIKQAPLYVLGAVLVGLLGAVPMVALNLALDVFHPKLIWNTEQEAMKQNMNSGIGMLLSLLVMLIMGIVALVMLAASLPMWSVFAAIGAVSVILGVLTVFIMLSTAEKKFAELEA